MNSPRSAWHWNFLLVRVSRLSIWRHSSTKRTPGNVLRNTDREKKCKTIHQILINVCHSAPAWNGWRTPINRFGAFKSLIIPPARWRWCVVRQVKISFILRVLRVRALLHTSTATEMDFFDDAKSMEGLSIVFFQLTRRTEWLFDWMDDRRAF